MSNQESNNYAMGDLGKGQKTGWKQEVLKDLLVIKFIIFF
jgi:hypothetical protein